jgi:hypothetical protein
LALTRKFVKRDRLRYGLKLKIRIYFSLLPGYVRKRVHAESIGFGEQGYFRYHHPLVRRLIGRVL